MRQKKFSIVILLISLLLISCNKENPIVSETETLVFEREGIIESLGGDCSAVQIRTSSLGNLDFTNIRKIKINLTGFSDADLSSISIFYLQNNDLINLINLSDREQINNTRNLEINSPNYTGEIFLRVTLKSSVCTGQIFTLELRDLKIYTIR